MTLNFKLSHYLQAESLALGITCSQAGSLRPYPGSCSSCTCRPGSAAAAENPPLSSRASRWLLRVSPCGAGPELSTCARTVRASRLTTCKRYSTAHVGSPSSYREASTPAAINRGFIGMFLPGSRPSLRRLLGSRPGHLEGLHMDLVSHPQLLQEHEAIPPCEPHTGPNGQAHLAPTPRRQH
jgi:hypothetical protein